MHRGVLGETGPAHNPFGRLKPAFAPMADRATGRYVGSAFNSQGAIRDRLWRRVQEHAGPAPQGMKRSATQWVRPGTIGRVKHLRGEEDLRHASLQDFREERRAHPTKSD